MIKTEIIQLEIGDKVRLHEKFADSNIYIEEIVNLADKIVTIDGVEFYDNEYYYSIEEYKYCDIWKLEDFYIN